VARLDCNTPYLALSASRFVYPTGSNREPRDIGQDVQTCPVVHVVTIDLLTRRHVLLDDEDGVAQGERRAPGF